MKLECFQLSFDIHIEQTNQKFCFFPNHSIKIWEIFPARLIDFFAFYKKKPIADWMFFKDSIGE